MPAKTPSVRYFPLRRSANMASSMGAPATPQTPSAQTPQPQTPNGTWKHPKFDEITRRQYATTFDEHNVKVVVANTGLLACSFFAGEVTSKVTLLGYPAYVTWENFCVV